MYVYMYNCERIFIKISKGIKIKYIYNDVNDKVYDIDANEHKEVLSDFVFSSG